MKIELIYHGDIADQAAAAGIQAGDVEELLEAMGFEPHTVECYVCGDHHQVLAKREAVEMAGAEAEYYVEISCACSEDDSRGYFVDEVAS